MGRSPCCDKLGLKKGPWTPEEDQKLLSFIEEHGHGNWRALPSKAGLQRCGKSCRLRWTNYLRPDIKRGKFSLQEEQTIIQLHALLGNRWSAIATHLPKRTDNEIKNYWNTHLKKRLTKMGIDPVTHKPKNDALLSAADGGQQSKNAANLSHMAQWESARLEAEARLVRQSKLRSSNNISNTTSSLIAPLPDLHINDHHQIVPSVSIGPLSSSSSTSAHQYLTMTSAGVSGSGCGSGSGSGGDTGTPSCIDVLKAWHNGGGWPSTSSPSANNDGFIGISMVPIGIGSGGLGVGIESPTSTLSFSENNAPTVVPDSGTTAVIEFMGHHHEDDNQDMVIKKEGDAHHHNHSQHEWSSLSFIPSAGFHDINALSINQTTPTTEHGEDDGNHNENDNDNDNDDYEDDEPNEAHNHGQNFMEGFTDLLLSSNTNTAAKNDITFEKSQQEDNTSGSRGTNSNTTGTITNKGSDYFEDNKTYWNSILNLVNSSPSHSPMF